VERSLGGRSDTRKIATVRGTAREIDMLTIVELQSLALERPGRSAKTRASLQERDMHAAVNCPDRRAETGESRADDDDVWSCHILAPLNARSAARTFSLVESETRDEKIALGSSSMRASRRR